MRLDCKQSQIKGQDVFERQLQVGGDGFGILLLIMVLLCELVNEASEVRHESIADCFKDIIQFM